MNTTLKRILSATWKVGLGLFGLAVFGVCILIACTWYEKTYGRSYWNDKTLSENIEVRGYYNGCFRVWDRKTAS